MADGLPRSAPLPPASSGPAAALSKAQQFEDEKRRVITSCFSKTDTDGSLIESYITHCRVVEDAAHPADPPPPDAPLDNKKMRVILVAVRKSGRVRMHKARENANGSFSIGKTWNLDDLQEIRNHPAPHEKGFTVTIIKPYYWQANSTKEKDFFISSMLKIYKKYTGGKIPRLEGFEKPELDALLGPGAAQLIARQRQEDAAQESRRPKTPNSNMQSSSSSSSLQQPGQRNLSSTVSMDSLSTPVTRTQPSPRQPSPRGKSEGSGPTTPGAGGMRPSKSSDMLASRRAPNSTATAAPGDPIPPVPQPASRGRTPPAPYPGPPPSGRGPPIPSPGPPSGRRPSDDRGSGYSQSGRSNSRPPSRPDDARAMRRAPSKEGLRTPSTNGPSREAMEQYPLPLKSPEPSPAPPSSAESQVSKKKSAKDVAASFRLAAGAYQVMSPPRHPPPKTPTTPSIPDLATKNALYNSPPESAPEMPPLGYPSERKKTPMPWDTNGNGSGYDRRPSMDSRPSLDTTLSRTQSGTLSDGTVPTSTQPSPAKPREPPPQSEARKGPPSREASFDSYSQSPIAPPKANRRPSLSTRPSNDNKMQPISKNIISPPIITPPTQPRESLDAPSPQLMPSPKSPSFDIPLSLTPRSRPQSPARRQSDEVSTYIEGLDTSILSVNLEEILDELKWDGRSRVDALEANLKKELSRVESSNVVIGTDGDDRVNELADLLDEAIKGCEEMDSLLTLYAVELSSLNDDIAHIENQSQGLQVQAANQKTLHKELQSLLQTVSISPQQMETLKQGSLESAQGLEVIEKTLVALYKAMQTIEPSDRLDVSTPKLGRRGSWSDEGIGTMRALQERKDEYRTGTRAFIARLHQFMQIKFQAELIEVGGRNQSLDLSSTDRPKLMGHENAYNSFWRFAGLMAFARDMDSDQFMELQRLYERTARQTFQDEFRDHIHLWRRLTKKPTQDDTDLVFTTPEKEEGHAASTSARKLTVKKSLARIRPRGESVSLSGSWSLKDMAKDSKDGRYAAHEAFAAALGEIYTNVLKEQNFNVEFFHVSSQSATTFPEFIAHGTVSTRRLGDLGGLRAAEPDKTMAKQVFDIMNEIFIFLLQELQGFVEWATASDPVQGVGIMYAIEQKLSNLEDTDQEWLAKTLQKLHERLNGLFAKFLEEQVRAIDETKVKTKKRKGVIGFMRVFPAFAAKIEEQLPPEGITAALSNHRTGIREMVNEGYEKLNKAMFESLQAIAKESPAAAPGGGGQSVDPEDKEQLNYHIMMIENMHHYLEEVETRQNSVLESFKQKAQKIFREHMEIYINAVIRRPIGKLLDFIENVEVLQRSSTAPTDIVSRSSHSKHVFKKILGNHDGKEIRKGIEVLKKRVEKHFGEGDDAALAQRLVETVLMRLQEEYISAHKRCQLLTVTVYKEQGLEMEFMVQDVVTAFRK